LNKNAKAWVKALRSKKYEQGQHFLRKDNRYCCLGVACELYAKEHPGFKISSRSMQEADGLVTVYLYGQTASDTNLPSPVMRWLNLNDPSGHIESEWRSDLVPEHILGSLAAVNDHGASFEKIADLIESEPTGLFASKAKVEEDG